MLAGFAEIAAARHDRGVDRFDPGADGGRDFVAGFNEAAAGVVQGLAHRGDVFKQRRDERFAGVVELRLLLHESSPGGFCVLGHGGRNLVAGVGDRLLRRQQCMAQALHPVGEALCGLVAHLHQRLAQRLDLFREGASGVVARAAQCGPERIRALGEGVGRHVADVGQGLAQGFDALREGERRIVPHIGQSLTQRVHALREASCRLVAYLDEGVAQGVGALGEACRAAVADFAQALAQALDAIREGANRFIADHGHQLARVLEGRADLVGFFGEARCELVAGLRERRLRIIQNVAQGDGAMGDG